MNLSDLMCEVSQWAEYNFPDAQPHQPLLGALEELGELAHAHLKEEQGIRGLSSEHQAAKVDAIGDVVIYLAHYCSLNCIDFADAVEQTWRLVAQRDWQKNKLTGE
jgi:NTP pyrophosphatase (non-canonical NTP hydrolase)